jgi:hypothetical protein
MMRASLTVSTSTKAASNLRRGNACCDSPPAARLFVEPTCAKSRQCGPEKNSQSIRLFAMCYFSVWGEDFYVAGITVLTLMMETAVVGTDIANATLAWY